MRDLILLVHRVADRLDVGSEHLVVMIELARRHPRRAWRCYRALENSWRLG